MDNKIKQYEKLNRKADCITYRLPNEENKIMNKELKIDPELRDLLPPLTEKDFSGLEELILEEGCLTPIALWNGYIADGHHRYDICKRHNISFQTYDLAHKEKSEVMKWMIKNQDSRRNLSTVDRIKAVEKYRDKLKEEAKERQVQGKKVESPLTPFGVKVLKGETSKELAKLAEVGSGTMARYEYVMNNGDEELKTKMLNNEIPITTAYDKLHKNKQTEQKEEISIIEQKVVQVSKPKTKECVKCGFEKSLDEFYIGHDKCKDCEQEIKDKKLLEKDDYISEIIKDIKTEKIIVPTFNFINTVENIKENIQSYIEMANDDLFEKHDIESKITEEDKNVAIQIFDELLNEITIIKNKIKNIKEII